jgi:uncharacterized protein (DUF1778 family)
VKATKPRVGRPVVPQDKAKGALLSVRFSADERAALDAAAERGGVKLSEWARSSLLAAAGITK